MHQRTVRALRATLACSIAMLLGGCGNLDVQMQVLNPAVVRAFLDTELTEKLLPQIVASSPETLGNQVRQLKQQHLAALSKLADTYSAEAQKLPEDKKKPLLVLVNAIKADAANNRALDNFYVSLERSLVTYADNLRSTLGQRNGIAPADRDYHSVLSALRVWQQRVVQAEKFIGDNIERSGGRLQTALLGANAPAAAALQASAVGAPSAVKSELAQLSLQNSPAAYAIASADDKQWATRYNHVLTRSAGGASDVAIRLDPATGNYMLKGLSFDPADVAAVAAKVATQAMLLAAQTSGVPVKTSTAPDSAAAGKAIATASGALVDAQASTEAARARVAARRAALIELAQTILGEQADLAGDDATRRAAMASIRGALDRRLPIIRPATSP